jgi:glycogen operon protein
VLWYGTGAAIDMSFESHELAFYLDGASENDDDLYVMINAGWREQKFTLQQPLPGWRRVIDTARDSPGDILEPADARPLASPTLSLKGRSIVVLVRPRQRR